jgi:flagellar biosynthesis chaperone FliJ
MNKLLIPKVQSLLKTIKKTLPQIRNRYLAKELLYKSLKVIEELKKQEYKEEENDKDSRKT